jgi:hypothetical protein
MNNKIVFIYMVFLMMGVVVFNGAAAQAAEIHVTTTKDNVPGSLRAAITRANTDNEDNTIYLPAGTYFLSGAAGEDTNASGDLDISITRKITLIGAGKTKTFIDGKGIDRVLHILKGTVSIIGVTVQNGKSRDADEDCLSNGENGGGIYNAGTLSLNDCCIKSNRTGGKGWDFLEYPHDIHLYYGGGVGGGIYNYFSGILNIENCFIENNITGSGGGFEKLVPGDGGDGGGIYNDGTGYITNSSITGNIAGNGGETGFWIYRTGIPGYGGGICNFGNLKITNSAICNNTSGSSIGDNEVNSISGGGGGGIFNKGKTELKNCTISNNTTGNGCDGYYVNPGNGGDGGGIFNWGNLFLKCCTICFNITGSGGAFYDDSSGYSCRGGNGGGIYNIGTVKISNTIVGNNQVALRGEGPDGCGNFNSQGYNLVEDIAYCTISGILTGNITAVDPLLAPLADNGGPTYTHALLPGSPAIDAGNSFDLSGDQRGYTRPVDMPGIANASDGADIGAYEFNVSCSIAGAITCGGSGMPGVTLTFSNNGGTTSTSSDGHYSHTVLYNWSGTVTPVKEGYFFIPANRNYSPVRVNLSNQDYSAAPDLPPQISLNRTQLYFGANTSGNQTGPQSFLISNSGGGILKWTAAVNVDWLSCNPASGTGSVLVTVSINPSGLLPGTYYGSITVADSRAGNSPQMVNVKLIVYSSSQKNLPQGVFDTPISGSTVTGSIPVTGWAIDNIGIETVIIYRNPVTGESGGLVYIGDAVFVEGARSDIEAAFPGYPNNYKAGWGYLMLTNALPGQGNGTFTLYAKATDKEGNTVTLGTKTIYCDNAHAVKPFGALDTPAQGGAASGGSYINFGWALTPLPNTIPRDGSTIIVWVDGLPLGHPVYNRYRADIAALFPGYNNSDGAAGYYYLDTTPYKNGVHTISWSVKDSAGNTDGIGSRYFTIQNTGTASMVQEIPAVFTVFNDQRSAFDVDISQIPMDYYQQVQVRKGCDRDIAPQILYPDDSGNITIEINQLERIEIYLPGAFESLSTDRYGYQLIGDRLKALPIGSSFNGQAGVFSWQPGPGFFGVYELVFITRTGSGEMERKQITIEIRPEFTMAGGWHE